MKDSENVDTFYTRVVGLINKLKYHVEPIAEVVEKILRSLPPRFENLVVNLEEHTYMMTFTIDELQDSLINHEHRLSRTQTSLEGAFAAQSSISRGRGRGINKFRGRGRSSSRGGQGRSPANVGGRGDNQNPSQPSGQRLINKKFNVITIRSLVIMHMNAGRNNMTKEGKSQIS